MINISKKIAIIAGTEATRQALFSQLQPLLEGYVDIKSYASDMGINQIIKCDLVVISSKLIINDCSPYIQKGCPTILARRTLNISDIDKLLSIPRDTSVLLVNDTPETTIETIELLKQFGIDHINYIPYYPGCTVTSKPSLAITPGESDLAPSFVNQIIDLGPRIIDITTVTEILERLGLLDEKANFVSAKYLETIIRLSKQLYNSIQERNKINEYLVKVLNQVNDGIIAFNHQGKITVFNEKCEIMFKLHHSNALGKNITQVVKDKNILNYLLSNDSWEEQIFKLHDSDIVISKFRVEKLTSTVCTIKSAIETIEMEIKLRKNLFRKGHISKYRFDDIISSSQIMKDAIDTAKKLSRASLSTLIHGESGTGKELFAGAMHNESPRASGPFLGVNFSALPEDLVESDLFGYEEGSFTGAKKGGKIGLFEQANNGTIFLDEIGDTSLKIQARLLRVLQEKEIMRVGGTEIIPINVRIIAATNKDLVKMCSEGKFREDLYYRLKKLYLKTPSLRFRKDDIPLLIKHFLEKNGRNDMIISEEVSSLLNSYDWPGNVRELENAIEYMVAVCDSKTININHIPQDFDSNKKAPQENFYEQIKEILSSMGNIEDFLFILKRIYAFNKAGKSIGRKTISQLTYEHIYKMSEEQIRSRTDILRKNGLISKGKGRGGMYISSKGIQLIENC